MCNMRCHKQEVAVSECYSKTNTCTIVWSVHALLEGTNESKGTSLLAKPDLRNSAKQTSIPGCWASDSKAVKAGMGATQ